MLAAASVFPCCLLVLGQPLGVKLDLAPEESLEWQENELSVTWLWRAGAEKGA